MAGLQRGAKPPWERKPAGVVTQADVAAAATDAVDTRFPTGVDGRPNYLTPTGSVVPVSLEGPGAALHGNASFENVTASTPDIWDFFWNAGGSVTTETTDVLFGSRSLTVSTSAGGGNNQIVFSDNVTVAGGDTFSVGVWAHAITGTPKMSVGVLSAASGTPAPFDGVSFGQESVAETLPATFTRYTRTFPIPAGHTVARLFYRLLPTAAEATSSRLDFTTSARTGASTPILPGNSWVKENCRVTTAANVATIAGGAPSVVDGVTLVVADRVLVRSQTSAEQNGIFTVTVVGSGANGTWVRASDALVSLQITGAAVGITSGTTWSGTRWTTTFPLSSIVGTSTMLWAQMLSDTGSLVLSGTTGAVMGTGSVGTSTFRDSVDARVAAVAVARCHVGYRSTAADQTLTTATLTAMNLAGTANHDVGSGFSIASNVVTITNAGVYQLHAFCPFNTNTGNCRNLLRIETWTGSDPGVGLATIIGAAELFGNTIISNWMNCNTQRTFAAGDKVRVVLYHTQGTNMTTQGATTPHQLNIARLS